MIYKYKNSITHVVGEFDSSSLKSMELEKSNEAGLKEYVGDQLTRLYSRNMPESSVQKMLDLLTAGGVPKSQITALKKKCKSESAKILKQEKSQPSKLNAFRFQKIVCSATKEDQDGFTAVFTAMKAGFIDEVDFRFSNKNTLRIDHANLTKFAKKFIQARQKYLGDN